MLELSAAFLTAAVAVTLVPAVRRSTPWPIEVLVWIGFIAVSFMTVASTTDPKAREVTASVAWGIGQLVGTEVSALRSGLSMWTFDHRYAIATFVVIGAGADALALAVVRSRRLARSRPRVRLNEWFVLPRTPIPSFERKSDPLAGLNRRLAAAGRARLESLMRPVLTSGAVVRLAVLASHVLGPGHMRLAMVKLALGISVPPPEVGARPEVAGEYPVAATAMRLAAETPPIQGRIASPHRRTGRRGAARGVQLMASSPLLAQPGVRPAPGRRPVRVRALKEKNSGLAPQRPHRLAS